MERRGTVPREDPIKLLKVRTTVPEQDALLKQPSWMTTVSSRSIWKVIVDPPPQLSSLNVLWVPLTNALKNVSPVNLWQLDAWQ